MGRIPSSILSEWKQPQQQPQQQQQQQHEIKSSRLSSSFIYGGAATTAEIWPPRLYSCSFCRREFRSAQALGGHMNVHRRDRALLRRRSPPPPSLEEDNSSNSNSLQTNIPQPSKRSDLPFHISTTNSANLPLMESFFLTQPQSKNPLSAMQVERSSNYYSSCRRSYLHSFRSNPYTKDSSLPSNHIQTEEALHSSPGNLRLSHSDSNSNTFHLSNKALCSNYFEPVNSPQALPNELDLELRLGYSDLQSFSKTPP